jgi:hypothetical protein
MAGDSLTQGQDDLVESSKMTNPGAILQQDIQSIPSNTEITGVALLERETALIIKRRKKLRLISPSQYYFYRHVPIKYTHTLIQSIFMTISLLLIIITYASIYLGTMKNLPGVGEISELTIVDYVGIVFVITYTLSQCIKLFKAIGPSLSKRYKIGMLSNAVNYFVWKQFIFLLMFTISILAAIAMFIQYNASSPTDFLAVFENGVFADLLSAAYTILTIFLVIRATYYFDKKEVA